MTSKKKLNMVVSNSYQPVSSRWCPKSLGLTSDRILLLSDESLSKGEDRKKNTIHKSVWSNLLVDKTKSIVKLIIFVFSFALKVILPNSKICVSEKSVLSNSVWSMVTKLFRSVRRSLLYKGQWRKKWIADSTSLPQLHIGFSVSWKLCLNLCSRRWLSPSRIRVIYLIPIGLWQSKNELEEGCMNFSMLILQTLQLLHLRRLGSNLFDSIIA